MPLQATAGAATYDAFGGGVTAANYIEDVFSTFLYTGTGSGTQTITNGIDLSGKGGLVWIKSRTGSTATTGHALFDTARGREYGLATQSTGAQQGPSPSGNDFSSFNSDGFTVSATNFYWTLNPSGASSSMASWTFRKQPKFFDVVTYTGNGSNRTISHSLGSVPGCIIVKRTDSTGEWVVYHRSIGATNYVLLNQTIQSTSASTNWNNTDPTASVFSIGTDSNVNASGGTYVAYLFAHDAGGFGASGTDNVISCGSFTTDTNAVFSVTLGYEPQWVLVKRSDNTGSWNIIDTMRGFTMTGEQYLRPDNSNAEASVTVQGEYLTATGFAGTGNGVCGSANATFIYIAIRRGPMRTPTSGTSVYSPVTYTGNGSSQSLTAGFPIDLAMFKVRNQPTNSFDCFERLLGTSPDLRSAYSYAALATTTEVTSFASNTQVSVGASSDTGGTNASGYTYVLEAFQRAPGFFDVVCYTGTGSSQNVAHNLGVKPEMCIAKARDATGDWCGAFYDGTYWLDGSINTSATLSNTTSFNTNSTATTFNPNDLESATGSASGNSSSTKYVAYLFATVAGVSKVGSYTGTGTTLQVNCGFTGGARFVLIKRTDSTGDWYVWDSARGIVAGNDPYLLLNDAAAEVTSTDYVDTYSAGFEISSTAPAAINANGGTFIFLAIA